MRNAVRFLFFSSLVASAQQTAKTEFEVASVRQSRPEEQPYTNFPLGPGPEFKSGGYLGRQKHAAAQIHRICLQAVKLSNGVVTI